MLRPLATRSIPVQPPHADVRIYSGARSVLSRLKPVAKLERAVPETRTKSRPGL